MHPQSTAGGRTPPDLRRARLATATLFFANGCGLGSWLPHRAAVLAAWPALLPTDPAPAGGPLFVLPRGRLAVLGGVALIAFMAEGAMGDWSAIYLRMDLGASPATAAYGFAPFSLTMAIGRFTGDRLVARFGPVGIAAAGAVIGAFTLGMALLIGHPAAAVLGFAGMGLGLANIAPIVFSAAGRLPNLAPGIGIAAVSTAGYGGFLAGPAAGRPGRRGRRTAPRTWPGGGRGRAHDVRCGRAAAPRCTGNRARRLKFQDPRLSV